MSGLGRHAFRDPRNESFRIMAVAPTPPPTVKSRYWNDSAIFLDQGDTNQCTAYSLLHYMADGPVTHRGLNPIADPVLVYDLIQQQDLAEGRDYGPDGGATMLAQQKAALSLGWTGEYRWGYTLEELVTALLTTGPVILGINWYSGFDDPDKTGKVALTGALRGGHAIECNGVSLTSERFRLKNSWGKSYGLNGHCYVSFPDMERLIKEDGEVVLARELKSAQPPTTT